MVRVLTGYWARVEKNVVPLSVADDVFVAIREWAYRPHPDRYKDMEEPIADCGFCDQPGCRYLYRIENDHTKKHLWIGSQCIIRYIEDGLRVYDETGAKLLDEEGARKALNRLEKRMRRETFISQMETVAGREESGRWADTVRSIRDYFSLHGHLTPKQMDLILWRSSETGVAIDAHAAKITLRRHAHRDQVVGMPDWRYEKLRPYLSPTQRDRMDEMRAGGFLRII